MTTARSDAAVARRAPAARRTTPILIVGASLLAVALAGWTLGRATSLDPTALATTFPRHPRESGIQESRGRCRCTWLWMPASAGMTVFVRNSSV